MSVEKKNLSKEIHNKIDELIEEADKTGNLNHMEISIKHTDGVLIFNKSNTYKVKL